MWRAVIAAAALAGCSQIFGLAEPQVSMLPDDAPPGTVRIGGSVSGLVGAGLVLENNGADDDAISSNGAFVFPSTIPAGSMYDITVGTQPTDPSQACTVASGAGTAATDVTDIAVSCATASYTVGGTVGGLNAGTQVILANNGTDAVTVSANAQFAFPTAVASGSPYVVTVTTQPSSGGPCNVFGGTGTVGNANVTTVSVNCSATMFAIGGSVTGLNGTVHLRNSTNGDTVTISANGSYAFPMLVTGAYGVTVMTQPTYPPTSQTCTVANGSGTASGNVTNINVTCVTNQFSIGGVVTGLTGGTLVLEDNAGDDTPLTMSGAFTFATKIASGMTYAVTAKTQPTGLVCTLANANGTVANANVTNVAAACSDPGVLCGSSYCAGGQVCCEPEGMAHCQSAAQSCKDITIPCDDAADCPSLTVCCADLNASKTRVNRVSCSALQQCQDLVMCNPSAPVCPTGMCKPFALLPGYYACQ